MLTSEEKQLLREALCNPLFLIILKSKITPELLEQFASNDELVRAKLLEYNTMLNKVNSAKKIRLQAELIKLGG